MQKHRTTILMAVLLALVGFFVFQSQKTQTPRDAAKGQEEPLDGENEIRNVTIKSSTGDRYIVEVEYYYRGDLGYGRLRADPLPMANSMVPEATGRPIFGRNLWPCGKP